MINVITESHGKPHNKQTMLKGDGKKDTAIVKTNVTAFRGYNCILF